jgi:hypothetical protein
LNPPRGSYTKYDDLLLEQYKIYVDSSQKVADRRLSTNNYLLTINSSLLTLLGLLASLLDDKRPLVMLPVAGLLISSAWYLLLQSFKRLNGAKFDVIQEVEKVLPANVFEDEWRRLTTGNRRPYRAMSDLERIVPLIFVVFYLLAAVFVWTWHAEKESKIQKIQLQSPVQIEMKNPPIASPPASATASPTPVRAKNNKH